MENMFGEVGFQFINFGLFITYCSFIVIQAISKQFLEVIGGNYI
jgi:hypothetical protein